MLCHHQDQVILGVSDGYATRDLRLHGFAVDTLQERQAALRSQGARHVCLAGELGFDQQLSQRRAFLALLHEQRLESFRRNDALPYQQVSEHALLDHRHSTRSTGTERAIGVTRIGDSSGESL
jgi:hypothetical protein